MASSDSLTATDWVPQKINMLKFNPQCDGIWTWGPLRVQIKSWGHERNNVLIKETREYSLLPFDMWGHRQKTVINQESDLTNTKSAGALVLDSSVIRTVRNKFLLLTTNLWYYYSNPNQMNTPTFTPQPRYLVSLLFSSALSKLLCQASTPHFTTMWDAFLPRYLQSLFSHPCPNSTQVMYNLSCEAFWILLNYPGHWSLPPPLVIPSSLLNLSPMYITFSCNLINVSCPHLLEWKLKESKGICLPFPPPHTAVIPLPETQHVTNKHLNELNRIY